jgi:hypothetical protein
MKSWQRNRVLLWSAFVLSLVVSAWCLYSFAFFAWAADFPKDKYHQLYAARATEYLVAAILTIVAGGCLAFAALRGRRKAGTDFGKPRSPQTDSSKLTTTSRGRNCRVAGWWAGRGPELRAFLFCESLVPKDRHR